MSDGLVSESRLRVLAVDSDDDSRYLLNEILIRCDIELFMFGRASDALLWLENEAPDLLISELRLIDGDGYVFVQEAKALLANRQIYIPAIALTASALPQDQVRARLAGFDIHIAKPFMFDDLIFHISALTRRSVSLADDDIDFSSEELE